MASLSSRASAFWADPPPMSASYFPDDDAEDQNLVSDSDPDDHRTPLDKTIDRIGMGSYQWTLLSLCGFGWLADNMWLQAIAIILPRVQQHWSVPDNYIGALSSSMFAGMMVGAVGWGACSDMLGRSTAFNATLFFTAVFGLLASLANSFPMLCVILFLLGSAVGGSMPTDGTLLLEHMPQGKQYLVTALSVFFSFGAVLAAVVGLLVLPKHSCPPASTSAAPCDVESQNQGWKYLLIALGVITLSMFLARMVFFRLHESPRYLVHAGRPQEAIESLHMISRFNGNTLTLTLEDVEDHRPPGGSTEVPKSDETEPMFNAPAEDTQAEHPTHHLNGSGNGVSDYHATSDSSSQPYQSISQTEESHQQPRKPTSSPPLSPPRSASRPRRPRLPPMRRSSVFEKRFCSALPRWLRRPLWGWWDRVQMVLTPEWLRITLLVWAAWCAMSLAYTMFNVFLPKLLETSPRSGGSVLKPKTLEESLWDVVIFTLGGCPGAILGAYLVEVPFIGRRWSLAGSTFLTAIFCVIFVYVESAWSVRLTTVGISLSATTMWAVLYGWTPEIFGTKVRGTACGIASALSRIGGMIAPIIGGILLMIHRSIPVYTSVVVFALAGICVLFLKESDGDRMKNDRTERIIVH